MYEILPGNMIRVKDTFHHIMMWSRKPDGHLPPTRIHRESTQNRVYLVIYVDSLWTYVLSSSGELTWIGPGKDSVIFKHV
jgi:hypothetical protein